MESKAENGLKEVASGVENVDKSKGRDDEAIVQRVIRLRDTQEEETEDVNDEDFMKEMDVVDAWEGDEDRLKEEFKRKNRPRDREKRLSSRERRRLERRAESRERERLRREERKREPARRDPSKSNKDIERDKIRAKRDSESKILAEKERAIKHILDSDEVVPPGTEEDAIESIVEKQSQQESSQRRKSLERYKLSPTRRRRPSPFRRRSPLRRSPFQMSPDRRRSPNHRRSPLVLSPDRRRSLDRRRRSWDRRSSTERRWSIERQKRRIEQRERELKLSTRRSRSRDRHRSPSTERRKRYSRSPRRRSPSRSRSPDRRRKRSPFINEIARQLRNEIEVASTLNRYTGPTPVNVQSFQHQTRPPLLPNPNFAPQGPVMAGPALMSGPVAPSGLAGLNTPSGIQGPGGAPRMSGPPFINFDLRPPRPMMNFDQMPAHLRPPNFAPGLGMYGQPNPTLGSGPVPVPVPMPALGLASGPPILGPPGLPLPVPSPQPVPAPGPLDHSPMYNQSRLPVPPISPKHKSTEVNRNMNHSSQQLGYHDRRPSSPYTIHEITRDERLKTPEPPVISDSKRFEKTSLSSLLEASVSKDSKNSPVLYPGFRPEILRRCEYALRDLPPEDPRLKMKGRFFFDPSKELTSNETAEEASNSILLRKGKNKIDWVDLEEPPPPPKVAVQMHQKICQTEELERASMGVQATASFAHIGTQVFPSDLQQPFTQQEKRAVTDRLDWNLRETYDYNSKVRDTEDLRWSLNSSQKRPWGRAISSERPLRPMDEHNLGLSSGLGSSMSLGLPIEHPRSLNLEPSLRERDPFPGNRGPMLDHMRTGNYVPTFNRSLEERGNFRDERGNFHDERDHFCEEIDDPIRGESPMALDDPSEDLDMDQGGFSREPVGPSKAALFFKSRVPREIPMGVRPAGRGNFRGKYW